VRDGLTRQQAAAKYGIPLPQYDPKRTVTAIGYSPFSSELRDIYNSGRQCLMNSHISTCSGSEIAQIQNLYEQRLKERGAAISDAEKQDFQSYLEYLEGKLQLLPDGNLAPVGK
jgi:hypothetical protein